MAVAVFPSPISSASIAPRPSYLLAESAGGRGGGGSKVHQTGEGAHSYMRWRGAASNLKLRIGLIHRRASLPTAQRNLSFWVRSAESTPAEYTVPGMLAAASYPPHPRPPTVHETRLLAHPPASERMENPHREHKRRKLYTPGLNNFVSPAPPRQTLPQHFQPLPLVRVQSSRQGSPGQEGPRRIPPGPLQDQIFLIHRRVGAATGGGGARG